jgi:hypothetical protein
MEKSIRGFVLYFGNCYSRSAFRIIFFALYLCFTAFSAVFFFASGKVRDGFLALAYFALFTVMLPVFEYTLNMRCGWLFTVVLFFIPIGGILGSCYDLYMLLPWFDTLLHTVSGLIFACLGYSIMERILQNRGGSHLASVLFALCFSLAIAVLWEMFEWLLTVAMNGDMQEDGIVKDINSYYLAGTHEKPLNIPNIDKTVIVYNGGETYTIEGGYLDLGVFDTLLDMLVCLVGAAAFFAISVIDRIFGTHITEAITPRCENITKSEKV